MGDKPVDAKIIQKTKDTLGKIIKKPPMSEKLLAKPPFRFLHDIMTTVIKSTGFMKGLFTEAEMNSDNVKEKEGKIAFLQKAIDMVSLVIGKPIAAKPSKIVAGHEPERTNEFLQALADAINKKVDNDDYVRRVLKSDEGSNKAPSKKESSHSQNKEKDESKSRSKKESDKKDPDDAPDKDKHRSKDKQKSRDSEQKESEEKDSKDSKRDGRHRSRENGSDKNDRDKSRDKEREKEKEKEKTREREKSRDKPEKKEEEIDQDEQLHRLQRPSSAKGSRRRQGRGGRQPGDDCDDEQKKENETNQSANRKISRPSSARPAPPKPKTKEVAHGEPVIVGGMRRPNVIVDKQNDSDDDDDGFIAKEEDVPMAPEPEIKSRDENEDDDEDHGGLVKKILETKKELETSSTTQNKKTEIERSQGVVDASRRKDREIVQKDIDKLRTSIQTLTRSVNPLGKVLDFLQEDLDSMQRELEVWKQENKENTISLQREQSITDSAIEPLKAQLQELESAISDQLDLIAAVKNNIFHNDVKITNMLSSVTKS